MPDNGKTDPKFLVYLCLLKKYWIFRLDNDGLCELVVGCTDQTLRGYVLQLQAPNVQGGKERYGEVDEWDIYIKYLSF